MQTPQENQPIKDRKKSIGVIPRISTNPRHHSGGHLPPLSPTAPPTYEPPLPPLQPLKSPSQSTRHSIRKQMSENPHPIQKRPVSESKPFRPINTNISRPTSGTFNVGEKTEEYFGGKKQIKIRIKTCHKTFVCSLMEKGQVEHSVNQLENEYIWTTLEFGSENEVFIQSCYNRFLTTEKGGKLFTTRTQKQTEQFYIEPIPNLENKFSIKDSHGEYLCALPGGSLQCNRFGPQAWETFEIEVEPFAPPVYGGNLNDIVVYQLKSGNYSQVPRVLEYLAEGITKSDGHVTEGIWRISGSGASVLKYRTQIQKGNYDESQFENCHDAATLFKLFLRELSEPVFPGEYYTTAIRLAEEQNIPGIQELIRKFDNINLRVLKFVINFLRSFLKPEYMEKTMMTASNLATVFAPTLLRCPSDNPLLQISVSTSETKVVFILLENFPEDLRENYVVSV